MLSLSSTWLYKYLRIYLRYDRSWGHLFSSFEEFLAFEWPVITVTDAWTGRAHIVTRLTSVGAFLRMIKTRSVRHSSLAPMRGSPACSDLARLCPKHQTYFRSPHSRLPPATCAVYPIILRIRSFIRRSLQPCCRHLKSVCVVGNRRR